MSETVINLGLIQSEAPPDSIRIVKLFLVIMLYMWLFHHSIDICMCLWVLLLQSMHIV